MCDHATIRALIPSTVQSTGHDDSSQSISSTFHRCRWTLLRCDHVRFLEKLASHGTRFHRHLYQCQFASSPAQLSWISNKSQHTLLSTLTRLILVRLIVRVREEPSLKGKRNEIIINQGIINIIIVFIIITVTVGRIISSVGTVGSRRQGRRRPEKENNSQQSVAAIPVEHCHNRPHQSLVLMIY